MSSSLFGKSIAVPKLKTLAFGSISGTYATIATAGTDFSNPIRNILWHNTTNAEVVLSFNGGTNDSYVIPAGARDVLDFASGTFGVNATTIQIKNNGTATTSGEVRVTAIGGV